MKPIAFVIPWYGKGITGGAENACRDLAHCFNDAGIPVEVLTTCVKLAVDDRGTNTLPSGIEDDDGVIVRRFDVRERDADAFHSVIKYLHGGQKVTLEQEKTYFSEDINSPDMYKYLREKRNDYQCFIFMPYLYGITYNGSKECPDNSVFIPCLHDESYAYMQSTGKMMEAAKGIIFLSKAESDLAHKLYNLAGIKTAILGTVVKTQVAKIVGNESFREKYNISDEYIIYLGRKNTEKCVDELIDFFSRYKAENPQSRLKLVLAGGGSVSIPEGMSSEIIDLGFLSDIEKYDALTECKLLCNPSRLESFSIVIMESWLAKRPILVTEHCSVTASFCKEARAGLYYRDYSDFSGCVDYLMQNEYIADQMGDNGYKYVQEHFSPDNIVKNYMEFIDDLF